MRVATIAVAVSMIAGASAFGTFHMHLTMVRFQSGSLAVPTSTPFAFNRVHGDDFQLRRRALLRLPVQRDGSRLLTNWHYSVAPASFTRSSNTAVFARLAEEDRSADQKEI
eukprot:scaffold32046_cov46-Attheya_sp.AAC.5